MDDGCDLVTTIYTKHHELLQEMIGGCEETTTGVIRLHAMEKDGVSPIPHRRQRRAHEAHVRQPVRHGPVDDSTASSAPRTSLIAGHTVVVARLRLVRARRRPRARRVMGADRHRHGNRPAARRSKAAMDGFLVMPMAHAAKLGDIFRHADRQLSRG